MITLRSSFRGKSLLSSSRIVRPLSTQSQTSVLTHEHRLTESKADRARKERRARARSGTAIQGSLVERTLQEMEQSENQVVKLTPEERKKRRRSLDGVASFSSFLDGPLVRKPTSIFQINIGLYCNQACSHCHVESSPRRLKEQMDRKTVDQCLKLIRASDSITTVDVTGGAPELNENFRYLVTELRAMKDKPHLDIIDRCNLTVLSEPGQEDLAQFLAENRVHVVASLPCYGADNVDTQRGNGVFDRSIAALLTLNERGYGSGGDLKLDLVYNPIGPFLPPEQEKLQVQYKKQLDDNYGIQFDHLFCITNMPIKRFADFLHRRGELRDYMELLVNNFNKDTVESVMCRDTISVRYDGALYDCDFNQQLDLPVKRKLSVFDVESTKDVEMDAIVTRPHCFGCTAGSGSSCQGEVA